MQPVMLQKRVAEEIAPACGEGVYGTQRKKAWRWLSTRELKQWSLTGPVNELLFFHQEFDRGIENPNATTFNLSPTDTISPLVKKEGDKRFRTKSRRPMPSGRRH